MFRQSDWVKDSRVSSNKQLDFSVCGFQIDMPQYFDANAARDDWKKGFLLFRFDVM